jgi:hypothetical protein
MPLPSATVRHREACVSSCRPTPAGGRSLLGLRDSAADFGLQPAGNRECLGCHDFPDERHPQVFRFNEPRFQKARDALHPEYCISCHLEHRGVRVTMADIGWQDGFARISA